MTQIDKKITPYTDIDTSLTSIFKKEASGLFNLYKNVAFIPNSTKYIQLKSKISINKIKAPRAGCLDMWNAFMVKGAKYSKHDMPLCPSTTVEVPKALIGFDDAKTIHNKAIKENFNNYYVEAFVHFYIDDQKFDSKKNSIWTYPEKALEILCHFAGIIVPDFSTYEDFPEPLKIWNFYRMNAFGYWIGSLGIATINNARWGGIETWEYCFDGILAESLISIGTVASGIYKLENQQLFEEGLNKLIDSKNPHILIIYGSSNYKFFDNLKERGIQLITFPSKTSLAFSQEKSYE